MAKKFDTKIDEAPVDGANVQNVEDTKIVDAKPSRKEDAAKRSMMDSTDGFEGVFTLCQRSNDTGDIKLNFEIDGHLVRATINNTTQRVKGRVIHVA